MFLDTNTNCISYMPQDQLDKVKETCNVPHGQQKSWRPVAHKPAAPWLQFANRINARGNASGTWNAWRQVGESKTSYRIMSMAMQHAQCCTQNADEFNHIGTAADRTGLRGKDKVDRSDLPVEVTVVGK